MFQAKDKLILTPQECDMLYKAGFRPNADIPNTFEIAQANSVYPMSLEEFENMLTRLNVVDPNSTPTQEKMIDPINRGILDIQVGGDHYKRFGNMQPWEVYGRWFTKEELRGFMKGTVMSYLARDKENQREDIEKAMHTIQLYLEISKKEGKE